MYVVFSDQIKFFIYLSLNIYEQITKIGKIKKINGNVMTLLNSIWYILINNDTK